MPQSGGSESAGRGATAGRRPWAGRRILLGVTGGIAAYKSVQLARDLTALGAEVDVVLTSAAREFVGSLSFAALTGRPVYGDLWAPAEGLAHIRLAREADVVCIAPATADLIARAAAGRADDMLAAILLATRAVVLLAPAMNDRMWSHPQTQRNATYVSEVLGYRLVGPASGPLAFDEGSGPGRMEDPATITAHIGRALGEDRLLRGRRIVVTAGPTREPVDAVRVLTNRSSGRMGYAIAAAAWRRGAEVTLIAGPGTAVPPPGPQLVPVQTTQELADAVRAYLPAAAALIMAAAAADFRPTDVAPHKLKKARMPEAIALEPAPDVLLETRAARPPGCMIVGFALETEDLLANGRSKLERKGLDLIVLNSANEPGAGFDVETNRVSLLDARGALETLPLLSKDEVAERVLDRVVAHLAGPND
ncbi:MAG TPA: bifunctional phosphopantothenoylcysteine decarboxylase/phosphopantothenate--cysteine ligase CoaBC [Longimicrobiales bacterium]|nr:bifunctional phosphopantothenoylcysteine decarboxylase/phosphopantothenate--cysteine ligase CoaBC [Longimicrobiales bacterium]